MKLKSMSRAAAVVAVAVMAGAAALPAVAQGDHPARHGDDGDHGRAHAHLPTTYTLPANALFPEGMGTTAALATSTRAASPTARSCAGTS